MKDNKTPSRTVPRWLPFAALAVLIALLCTACSAQAEFDIRGTWDYTIWRRQCLILLDLVLTTHQA
ncbi:MAG: hypothetical protein JXA89_07420 [Anaerolineae bacterium]|nr:hypothetical protein [Anaerolineae bacterium]